jgi:hypothetical protein
MQGNKTTKRVTAPSRQSFISPHVVVGRHNVGDAARVEPALVYRCFGKIILPGSKIKGSARVHCWTPPRHTDPIAPSHEAEISGKANYEASEIRSDQILSLSSTPFWLASLDFAQAIRGICFGVAYPYANAEHVMLSNLTTEVRECLWHADHCAERAAIEPNPAIQGDFIEMERSWLTLARSYQLLERFRTVSAHHEQQRGELYDRLEQLKRELAQQRPKDQQR